MAKTTQIKIFTTEAAVQVSGASQWWVNTLGEEKVSGKAIRLTIIVAALGYFVDVYDIVLFTAVRTKSLVSLGLSGQDFTKAGIHLLNIQLLGMLAGGLFWGVLGDKKGRTSVLFGSIILYSIANLLNAFVRDILAYEILRFLAGFGLAGELGAGITLVSELMKKDVRGYGTTIMATTGVCGGIVAGLIGNSFDWPVAYIIGGILGLLLLALRFGVKDSGLFKKLKESGTRRGELKDLLRHRPLLLRYLKCLGLGLPIWVFIGIFINLAPEIAKALSIDGVVRSGSPILFFNIGFGIGDLASGGISQYLKSRKKTAFYFILGCLFVSLVYLQLHNASVTVFYAVCAFLGLASGYWALFLTISAEQFGTNLRATVATSLPNFVRAAVIPMTWLLENLLAHWGMITSLYVLVFSALGLSLFCLKNLDETFHRDLDFSENT